MVLSTDNVMLSTDNVMFSADRKKTDPAQKPLTLILTAGWPKVPLLERLK
jgi:hypothetical protein